MSDKKKAKRKTAKERRVGVAQTANNCINEARKELAWAVRYARQAGDLYAEGRLGAAFDIIHAVYVEAKR